MIVAVFVVVAVVVVQFVLVCCVLKKQNFLHCATAMNPKSIKR